MKDVQRKQKAGSRAEENQVVDERGREEVSVVVNEEGVSDGSHRSSERSAQQSLLLVQQIAAAMGGRTEGQLCKARENLVQVHVNHHHTDQSTSRLCRLSRRH